MANADDHVFERVLGIIPLDKIQPNPSQPRIEFDEATLWELAQSIQEEGLIQPIEVEAGENGAYILHHGERRVRACRLAGIRNIQALVVAPLGPKDILLRALVENLQRQDMNPNEEAEALGVLAATGMFQT